MLQCDISDTNVWMRIPEPEPEFVVPDWPKDKGLHWYPKRTGLLGDWGYAADVSGKSSRRDNSCFITLSNIRNRDKLKLMSPHRRAPFLSRRNRSWHGTPGLAGLESLPGIPYSTTWSPSCGSCGCCASISMGRLTEGDSDAKTAKNRITRAPLPNVSNWEISKQVLMSAPQSHREKIKQRLPLLLRSPLSQILSPPCGHDLDLTPHISVMSRGPSPRFLERVFVSLIT